MNISNDNGFHHPLTIDLPVCEALMQYKKAFSIPIQDTRPKISHYKDILGKRWR